MKQFIILTEVSTVKELKVIGQFFILRDSINMVADRGSYRVILGNNFNVKVSETIQDISRKLNKLAQNTTTIAVT